MNERPLDILMYGHFAPFSGASSYQQAFARRGHEVVTYEDSTGLECYGKSLPLRVFRKLFNRPRRRDLKKHVAGFVELAAGSNPDLVVILKGKYIGIDAIRELRASGCWVANLNHDDFFSAYRTNRSAIQRAAIPAYNHIFCTRTVNVDEIRPRNPNVSFLPFAFDPGIHRPVPIHPEEAGKWNDDVVFIGTYAKHRARMMEKLIERLPDLRLSVYGPDWDGIARNSPLRPRIRNVLIFGDELCKAVGGAAISLGFLRKENRDTYTQRTFEIPASAGLLLAERTEMHRSIFVEGTEAEFFDADDIDELCRKVSRLLADRPGREKMRLNGMQAVLRGGHTYDDRISQMLSTFEASRTG